jgi:hypothetical protein
MPNHTKKDIAKLKTLAELEADFRFYKRLHKKYDAEKISKKF